MPIELLLFVAGLGALIAGVIASSKQRSVGGWAVFGACFPLIAIVAIACLPPKIAAVPEMLP